MSVQFDVGLKEKWILGLKPCQFSGKETRLIGHAANPNTAALSIGACHVWMAYVVKVLILYVQHQGFAAIGVDESGRRLSRCYKTLILCHSKLWMKMVHCQDLDYDCRNRILPGVIVLISLVARHKEKVTV